MPDQTINVIRGDWIRAFEKGTEASESLIRAWDTNWQVMLNFNGSTPSGDTLYGIFAELGQFLAVGVLLYILIQYIGRLNDGSKVLHEFLIVALPPVFIGILLFNQGTLLAKMTYEYRTMLNGINQIVLERTAIGINIQEAFQEIQRLNGIKSDMSLRLKECEYQVGEALEICLNNQLETLKQDIDDLKANNFFQFNLIDTLSTAINAAITIRTAADPVASTLYQSITGRTILNFFDGQAKALQLAGMMATMQAYQHMLEVCLLGTAFLGPIFVATMLLPGDAKPFYAWLLAFGAVGMAKLSYNLAVGILVVAIINAPEFAVFGDESTVYNAFAYYAPALASGLAAGGGIAIWQSLTSWTASGVNFVNTLIPG